MPIEFKRDWPEGNRFRLAAQWWHDTGEGKGWWTATEEATLADLVAAVNALPPDQREEFMRGLGLGPIRQMVDTENYHRLQKVREVLEEKK